MATRTFGDLFEFLLLNFDFNSSFVFKYYSKHPNIFTTV